MLPRQLKLPDGTYTEFEQLKRGNGWSCSVGFGGAQSFIGVVVFAAFMVQENSPRHWFPEPAQADATWGRPAEHPMAWLERSTLPLAKAIRDFLDINISTLPEGFQQVVYRGLWSEFRHRNTFFELIVGRTLQLLGASLEVEPEKIADNKRIDFVARFPDCVVAVEATSPVFDAEAGETIKSRTPLIEIIRDHTPEGWAVRIWSLPELGPSDSKRRFKAEVADMLDVSPPSESDGVRGLTRELPQGTIELQLWPKHAFDKPDPLAIMSHSPISVTDRTKEIVQRAVKRKREQARNSNIPVVLAVDAKGITSSLEEFDKALFGHTAQRMDRLGNLSPPWFVPDGIFAKGSGRPTIVGVLAFIDLGMLHAQDPVLYIHPRFDGELPEAIARLECRMYDVESNAIVTREPRSTEVLRDLGFPPKGI